MPILYSRVIAEAFFLGNKYFFLYSAKDGYTIVKGRIPLEVVNTIYEKYLTNLYKIRILGDFMESLSSDYAIDEKYNEDLAFLLSTCTSSLQIENAVQKLRMDLSKRPIANLYTKEVLVILLTELHDYCFLSNVVEEFPSIVKEIMAGIVENIMPCISGYDWMMEEEKYAKQFLETVAKENSMLLGKYMRESLNCFDKCVNLYLDDPIELDWPTDYIDRVEINAHFFDKSFRQGRDNCCILIIKLISSSDLYVNMVRYMRDPHGFSFELMKTSADGVHVFTSHYFKDLIFCTFDSGEHIYIDYVGTNCSSVSTINYNIANGTVKTSESSKVDPITLEQKASIIKELYYLARLVSKITTNNMKKVEFVENRNNN